MKIVVFILLLSLLAGCGLKRTGGYFEDDGPPRLTRIKLDRIPDAVPKDEPRSRGGNASYTVNGKTYHPMSSAHGYRERGIASWYGKKFHGRRTSSGERYNMYAMTAAHKTLPLPAYVRVKNLRSGKSVIVKVNDRGPFLHNRLIDLSYVAAAKLGIVATGTGIVEVEAITPGKDKTKYIGKTEPVADTDSEPRLSAKAPKLYLQVGAFRLLDNAEKLRMRLQQADFSSVIIQMLQQNKTHLFRVRIGPLATVNDGDKLVNRILKFGISDAHIVVD